MNTWLCKIEFITTTRFIAYEIKREVKKKRKGDL
jgi:hypothetical protein